MVTKKEWQEQQGFDDESMAKISVFVPPGKIISITNIVLDKTETMIYTSLKGG